MDSPIEEDGLQDDRLHATFTRSEEYFDVLDAFLAAPAQTNGDAALGHLTAIIEDYQEQAYLLDPYLERMVQPIVDALRTHLAEPPLRGDHLALAQRMAKLLYVFSKARGYKIIVRFFPHAVPDLPLILNILAPPTSPDSSSLHTSPYQPSSSSALAPSDVIGSWELRYILLLWLSIVCMLPFDLSRFDRDAGSADTALRTQTVGQRFIRSHGKEREGAAILLGKLFLRRDTASLLSGFVDWASAQLRQTPDIFLATGVLHTFCEILKAGNPEQLRPLAPAIAALREAAEPLTPRNSLLRKYSIKLAYRLGSLELPSASRLDQEDVSEGVENVIESMLQALQDRDTIVRWSAAKNIARVASRLPRALADDIVEAIVSLFSEGSLPSPTGIDITSVSDSTWHGAALAVAECARRGVLGANRLGEVLPWTIEALHFDLRKGSHSVGSNVRDATAYVLWSFARAFTADVFEKHAETIARHLVAVSLFDREVHIRRAASAAFQENVGRMGLFPDGIDVLRKTDFYAVGVRRTSFLTAAVEVSEHPFYRSFLIDHILGVTLSHWDASLREAGSQALARIAELDLPVDGVAVVPRLIAALQTSDPATLHGVLLSLAELAELFGASGLRPDLLVEIYSSVGRLPHHLLSTSRYTLVLGAANLAVAKSVSSTGLQQDDDIPVWKRVVDAAIGRRHVQLQIDAAAAMASVSGLRCCADDVSGFVQQFSTATPTVQQSLARILGTLNYRAFDHGFEEALSCQLMAVDDKSPHFAKDIESRRDAYDALAAMVSGLGADLMRVTTADRVQQVLRAFIRGLSDYTTDQRGDVGSWCRAASIVGLERVVSTALGAPEWRSCLDVALLHEIVGGILSLTVDPILTNRSTAGENLLSLLRSAAARDAFPEFAAREAAALDEIFPLGERQDWVDADWIFPRAVRTLQSPSLRRYALGGIVLAVGTRTESTARSAASSLLQLAETLPPSSESPETLSLHQLFSDLLALARSNARSNRVLVPVLTTLNLLVENDLAQTLAENDPKGLAAIRSTLDLASKGIKLIKGVPRILAAMKIVTGLCGLPLVRAEAAAKLPDFLAHPLPRIRTATSEQLYIVLQTSSVEDEELEEILLSTEWSSTSDAEHLAEQAKAVSDILRTRCS